MEYKGVGQTHLCVHTMLPEEPGMGTNAVKYISSGLPLPNPASFQAQKNRTAQHPDTKVSISESACGTGELGLINVFKVLRQ